MNTPMDVSNTALAKLIAHAAADTPGVARLAPPIGKRITGAALRAARQLTTDTALAPLSADPDAVDIDDPDTDGSPRTITVRIIATGTPPMIDTVDAVHYNIAAAVSTAACPPASVIVLIIDAELL